MNKVPFYPAYTDVLDGCRWEEKIDEHGMVALVDVMPRLVPPGKTADYAIIQMARVSYGEGTKTTSEDEGLIRYLMRHRHTTPFEGIEFKFHCSMPIFVARQWIRHRTANVNEYSARYSLVKDKFYHPALDNVRSQSNTNKQGGTEPMPLVDAQGFLNELETQEREAYKIYEAYTAKGLARELARIVLPINVYTEWYWKIDLHNLLHFLSLRMDAHAQAEIRTYANAMFAMLKEIVPITCKAFEDYKLNSITLSGPEIEYIKSERNDPLSFIDNKREVSELEAKLKRLGL